MNKFDPPESDDEPNVDWTRVSEPDPGEVQAWDIEPDGAYGWEPEE